MKTTPQAARVRAAGGSTPLMFAALYGDAEVMTRLIALGADPRAANVAGATALMWALPDTRKMRVLLDADVNVDARSDDRRTALVMASGIVGAEPAVRLLLEYGAAPPSGGAVRGSGPTPPVPAICAHAKQLLRSIAGPSGAGSAP